MQDNNSTSAEGSVSAPKPTKYRLACDSCQHSKIRCNQERPTCRRCAKKGIECVYSPARRAGRPRARNNSKSSSSVENIVSSSTKALTEHNITLPASMWMSPLPPHNIPIASGNSFNPCSCSCSCSNNCKSIGTGSTQASSSEDLELPQYEPLDDSFLQSLPNLTESQCETPKQNNAYYYPMSPDIQIAPEFLNLEFSEALQGQLGPKQQQDSEHHQAMPTATFFDDGQPYLALLAPESCPASHQSGHHREDMTISFKDGKIIESCGFHSALERQEQTQVSQLSSHSPFSTKSCDCVSTLLDYMSAPSQAPYQSCFVSTSAALSTSRLLITCCCAAMSCPNACSTRPSTALIMCEAIDRALLSLKLGEASVWTNRPAHVSGQENGNASSSSSPSSSSSTCFSNSTEATHASLAIDEEHEPLRCGTLPIRGTDRRAVLHVLLVKRALEMQGVLERLRDTFRSGVLGSGPAVMKKPLLSLCADMVEEFTRRVADRVQTVRLQM